MTLETTMHDWLSHLKIRKSRSQIAELLLSHPQYPSALSITETLSQLGIESGVFEISKEDLPNLPVPYLVHLAGKESEFRLVKKLPFTEVKDFEKKWSGIVVFAEKPAPYNNGKAIQTSEEKQTTFIKLLFGFVFLVFNVTAAFRSLSFPNLALIIISLSGMLVSWMIVSKELGIANSFAAKVCKSDSCDEIIKTKSLRLPYNLKPSDVCLVWFTSINILNMLFGLLLIPEQLYSIIGVASSLGFGISCLSIYYQAKILKKWCRLCLVIVSLLVILALVFVRYIIDVRSIGLVAVSSTAGIILFLTTGWLLVKKNISEALKIKVRMYEAIRFKYNPELFYTLLKLQPTFAIEPFENEIQLVNPLADTQITVVSSLSCGPCAEAHEKIEQIIEEMGDRIGVKVRFLFHPDDENNSRGQIMRHLLSVLNTNNNADFKRMVLHDWFKEPNLEKFKTKYNTTNPPVNSVERLISDHRQFISTSGIKNTPTIIVNEWKLPGSYSIDDIAVIFSYGQESAIATTLDPIEVI